MKPILLLLWMGVLAGCAARGYDVEKLEEARISVEALQNDQGTLSAAPKDVRRAGESLIRAQQLSGYWGSEEDVDHFAYLSLRYSELAQAQSKLVMAQARQAKLELDVQRLQLPLREAQIAHSERGGLGENEIANLVATETERGLVMTLGDVLFDTAHTELRPGSNRTLIQLARFLGLNPQRRIRIEGYTDNVGDAQGNLQLSKSRAQTVADTLESLGIDRARMDIIGYGESYPIAENASSLGRAQNRRVEVVFSDARGELAPLR
jgi:outer membrane protein OmpA-like peptidoglycan-associated protein